MALRSFTMALRTPEQYRASRPHDGRAVYFRGEPVQDVTRHPVIGVAVDHACIDYETGEDPKLMVARAYDGGRTLNLVKQMAGIEKRERRRGLP
jgi:aromatic ring hydroxylase